MGIGLEGAFGAMGATDALERLLAQRTAERMYQDKLRQQAFENQRQMARDSMDNRRLDQNDQFRRDQQAETKQQHAESAATHIVSELSPNQSIGPETGRILSSTNRSDLVRENPPVANQQFMLPGQSDFVPGQQPGKVFTGTAGQLNTISDNDRASAAAAANERYRASELERQQKNDERLQENDKETVRHHRALENKPGATITVQTVDENGKPVTRIVPKVAGASYDRAPNAVTANRLDSAQAVKQTGDDIVSQLNDPNFKAVVGPAMGRYSTLRDFIGDPPPEFSKLAGQIESYALANMGVHGMRSAQGAEKIKALLDARHTPESLINAIQGLNGFSEHFLTNAGRGSKTPTNGKPSAADLIKKYGGQ